MKERMVVIMLPNTQWDKRIGWLQDKIGNTEYYNVRLDKESIRLMLKEKEFIVVNTDLKIT